MPDPQPDLPQSWLIVTVARNGDLVYETGWRHNQPDGTRRLTKRRLGLAWVEPDGEGGYRRKRGRPKPGYLIESAAIVAKDKIVREVEAQLAEAESRVDGEDVEAPTFRRVAHAYLHWLEHVKSAKPSTLQEHRYLLAEPGTPHKRGKGKQAGHIMTALGARPARRAECRASSEKRQNPNISSAMTFPYVSATPPRRALLRASRTSVTSFGFERHRRHRGRGPPLSVSGEHLTVVRLQLHVERVAQQHLKLPERRLHCRGRFVVPLVERQRSSRVPASSGDVFVEPRRRQP